MKKLYSLLMLLIATWTISDVSAATVSIQVNDISYFTNISSGYLTYYNNPNLVSAFSGNTYNNFTGTDLSCQTISGYAVTKAEILRGSASLGVISPQFVQDDSKGDFYYISTYGYTLQDGDVISLTASEPSVLTFEGPEGLTVTYHAQYDITTSDASYSNGNYTISNYDTNGYVTIEVSSSYKSTLQLVKVTQGSNQFTPESGVITIQLADYADSTTFKIETEAVAASENLSITFVNDNGYTYMLYIWIVNQGGTSQRLDWYSLDPYETTIQSTDKIYIGCDNGNGTLYGIKIGDTMVPADLQDYVDDMYGLYGYYLVPGDQYYPTNGQTITIYQEAPAGSKSNISISVSGATTDIEDIVNRINVDNAWTPVSDNFTVNSGQSVELALNTSNYSISSFQVNNQNKKDDLVVGSGESTYTFTTEEDDYSIVIEVNENTGPSVTFICEENYEYIKIISNANSNKETVLESDEQTIDFAPEVTEISIISTETSVSIGSISISGNGNITSASPDTFFAIQNGAKVLITTSSTENIVYTLNCAEGEILNITQSSNNPEVTYQDNVYTVTKMDFENTYLDVALTSEAQADYELVSIISGDYTYPATDGTVSIRLSDAQGNRTFTVNVNSKSDGLIYTFNVVGRDSETIDADVLTFAYTNDIADAEFDNGSYRIVKVPTSGTLNVSVNEADAEKYSIYSINPVNVDIRIDGTSINVSDFQSNTTFTVILEETVSNVNLRFNDGLYCEDGFNFVKVTKLVYDASAEIPGYTPEIIATEEIDTDIEITGQTGYIVIQPAVEGYTVAYDSSSADSPYAYNVVTIDDETVASNMSLTFDMVVSVGDIYFAYDATKANENFEDDVTITFTVTGTANPNEPATATVSFTFQADADSDLEADAYTYVNVTRDGEKVVLSENEYSVTYGEEEVVVVQISLKEGYVFSYIDVSNSLQGMYNEVNGVYTFTLDDFDFKSANVIFSIKEDDSSKVYGLNATELKEATIYTLQGVKVDSNKLTKGIYIINGKKVVVR